MNKVKITVFADPVCTWCWGSVPVIRALRYNYGEQLEFEYVMSGMIEDITTFNNRRLDVGGDIALSNRNIHESWLNASAVHGMPVCEHGFHLFSEEFRSTLPQNYAFIAASVYVVEHRGEVPHDTHLHFLRRLQEATAVDAVVTSDVANIFDLAATVGMAPDKFRKIYFDERVKKIYDTGKAMYKKYDVRSLPTFLLRYRDEEVMLRGYSSCEVFSRSIERLTMESVKPITDGRERFTADNVKRFMEHFHSSYPVEIATAFGLKRKSGHTSLNSESYEGLSDTVAELIEQGCMAIVPKGNGFMYYLLRDGNDKHKERYRESVGIY